MKITIFSLIITANFSGNELISNAQCSDAGVCSVGHTMGDNSDNILDVKFGIQVWLKWKRR